MRTATTTVAFLGMLALVCPAKAAAAGFVFPPDSGVVDVTRAPYHAKGDGRTDDTAAIQRALDDHPSSQAVIYLPDGVYLVSETLRWPAGAHGGMAQKRTTLQGQSLEGTIIQLKDNCPGFGDPAKPKAVIWTGQKPAQRFRNGIRTLTVDTGTGNPGACGIQYIANNQGSMRHVRIRSGDGEGRIGLDLGYTDEQGPCLIQDVRVVGFDVGISTRTAVNSITFQNIQLEGQRKYGLRNEGQCVSIENLSSDNRVTAVANLGGVSLMTLVGATLRGNGGAAALPAIENSGTLYARNVETVGYSVAIESTAGLRRGATGPKVEEFLSHAALSMFASPARAMHLPIQPSPEVPWDDVNDWISPLPFGGNPDGKTDSTAALQKAIDSGKSTVYLPNGRWVIRGDVLVRGNVRRVIGCEAHLGGKGMLRVVAGNAPVVAIERLDLIYSDVGIEHASNRTLVISGVTFGKVGYENTGRGDLFLEDVCGGPFVFRRQNVWARQLNVENDGTHILNDGGSLWILGYKTERAGTLIETIGGGRTEVVGGFAYATSRPKIEPMFVIRDASASITMGESCFNNNPFITLVEETRGSETRRLYKGMAPGRTGGSMLPLYVGYAATSPSVPLTTPLPPQPAPEIPGARATQAALAAPPESAAPAPPLGRVAFPADASVATIEDFESLGPAAGEKGILLNGRGGWIVDRPEGVVLLKPAAPNTSGVAAQIRGRGNSTDGANYRVAEKLFDNPGYRDDQVVFYSAWMMAEPGDFGVAAWETNVAPRVPRTEDQPLTVHQYANFDGMGPVFGIARARDQSGTTRFRLKPVGGDWLQSRQVALPKHWYEIRLVIRQDAADISKSTGTLYYRDLRAGDKEFNVSDLKDVPLGLTAKVRPANFAAWVFQGKHSGQYDHFATGAIEGPLDVQAP